MLKYPHRTLAGPQSLHSVSGLIFVIKKNLENYTHHQSMLMCRNEWKAAHFSFVKNSYKSIFLYLPSRLFYPIDFYPCTSYQFVATGVRLRRGTAKMYLVNLHLFQFYLNPILSLQHNVSWSWNVVYCLLSSDHIELSFLLSC